MLRGEGRIFALFIDKLAQKLKARQQKI